jgi:3,4-dihydroxy 2-butanone 4-phosphate synthase/GTP cyclohydrolase II
MELNTIEELLDDMRQGKMIILMDDEDRENEGDLVMAAEQVRAEDINFMATQGRGLICLTLTEARCRQLGLPLMVTDNHAQYSTNFTVSIEAAEGVTTGISAADRARTIRTAVARDALAADIVQPGHIFPIMAQPGGVLSRAGHTEAGCDMARLAGFEGASVIVEIMNDDGTMSRRPDLEVFAKKHDLKIGTIADLIQYRSINEKTVENINQRQIKTSYGDFNLHTYLDTARQEQHFALTKGDVNDGEPCLVRVHVHSTARDVFKIQREADQHFAPWTFDNAIEQIAKEGRGALVMICHSESSQDIDESIDWMLTGKQQRPSQDLVYKQVGTGSQILCDLGVKKLRLMSAPFKFSAISGFDLEVVEYINNQ